MDSNVSGLVVNGNLLVDKSVTNLPDGASQEVTVISTGYPDSNTMVVDGGEWSGINGSGQPGINDSDVWSNYLTSSNGWADPAYQYQGDKAFDGILSGAWAASDNAGKLTAVLPIEVKTNDVISVFEESGFTGRDVTVNGNTITSTSTETQFTITSDSSNLTIEVDAVNYTGSATICGIKVRGDVLVDR